jgi:alanyl-tRNA synthetase
MAFALVPDSLVEVGLKADEWIRATLESCGGRGGGKPANAQGQAKECNDVDFVMNAANAFAEGKVKEIA